MTTGSVAPVPFKATRTVGVVSLVRLSPTVPLSLAAVSASDGAAGTVPSTATFSVPCTLGTPVALCEMAVTGAAPSGGISPIA